NSATFPSMLVQHPGTPIPPILTIEMAYDERSQAISATFIKSGDKLMRTKRIFIVCIAILLLATLAGTVYAAPNFQPSTPNVVGTWRITVPQSEGNPETFEAIHTFFADGNWVEANSFKESNHGVWIGSGNTYLLTFEPFNFDEQGKYNGKQLVRASIK